MSDRHGLFLNQRFLDPTGVRWLIRRIDFRARMVNLAVDRDDTRSMWVSFEYLFNVGNLVPEAPELTVLYAMGVYP